MRCEVGVFCTLQTANFTLNLEVIRLDEGPVLKTGGCRNVACEFESHGFRLIELKVYSVQATGLETVPFQLLTLYVPVVTAA